MKGTHNRLYLLSFIWRRSGVLATLIAITFFAQTPQNAVYCQLIGSPYQFTTVAQSKSGRTLKFDAVSIKPSNKDSGSSYSRTADGLRATHQSLISLILLAYLPMPLWSEKRVQNVPDWALRQEYDVLAKVAPEDIVLWNGTNGTNVQMAMLRSMLSDRFKLIVHATPTETSGFALDIAKHGPKLKPAAPNEALPKTSMSLSSGGVAVRKNMPIGFAWTFYAAPIASLANYFSMGSHTIIEDRTGLTGIYDFDLLRRDDADAFDHGTILDPASKWELEPLGLKTTPTKVHSVTIIIDHVEKPSDN